MLFTLIVSIVSKPLVWQIINSFSVYFNVCIPIRLSIWARISDIKKRPDNSVRETEIGDRMRVFAYVCLKE